MGKFLGLDIGTKRVGAAVSDQLGILASPLATFDTAQGRAEGAILEFVSKERVEALVVGMPYSDDGTKNEQCLKVENFCRRLKKRLNIEIYYVDEYATSVEAEEKLRSRSVGRGKLRDKKAIDAASAVLILQTFLDARQHSNVR